MTWFAQGAKMDRSSQNISADVIVVGSGLAGLTLSLILAKGGLDVACLDRLNPDDVLKASYDGRTTAISLGSKPVLQRAGIWDAIAPQGCAIRDIHITDNHSPVLLEFLAREVEEDAFGWIFENLQLRQAMFREAAKTKQLQLLAPCSIAALDRTDTHVQATLDDGRDVTAPLIVGADGRRSFVRDWANIPSRTYSYEQQAIICTAIHDKPHNNVAVEDFCQEGPFAILPMTDDSSGQHRSSVVWSCHNLSKDKSPLHWSDEVFNAALTARFPEWYGNVRLEGSKAAYPLGLNHAVTYIAERTALISDAAHGIHPIAGQGLNLGYRDVDVLGDLLINAKTADQDLGAASLLNNYQSRRRVDVMAMIAATDTLNRLFSNKVPPIALARKVGLKMVQKLPAARRFFIRKATTG